MRLSDVANSFNKTVCNDAYTGEFLFNGQLDLYDGNKRDSETAERRVLSVAPGTVPPLRGVIAAAGTRFIVGHPYADDFKGSTIRTGYVLHEAKELATVRSLLEVVMGMPGFSAYAGRVWVKNETNQGFDSDLTSKNHIHFSTAEPIVPDQIISLEGKLNIVRTLVYGPAGTIVTLCDQLQSTGAEIANGVTDTYDPVSEARGTFGSNIPVFRTRWQSLFAYRSNLAPKFGPGDIQLAIAKATMTARPGMRLNLADGQWQIESVVSEQYIWLCRAVRHV
jgi:hypothetical protein